MTAWGRIAWALVFAALITLARWIVLFEMQLDNPGATRFVLALLPAFAVGYILSLLAGSRSTLVVILGYLIAVLLLIVAVLAFHYFGYFGRYPGSEIAYYLSDLAQIAPSITANVPITQVVVGVSLAVLLLILVQRCVRPGTAGRRASLSARVAGPLLLGSAVILTGLAQVSDQWRAGTTEVVQDPLLSLMSTSLRRVMAVQSRNMPEPRLFLDFQAQIGHAEPFAGLAPEAPLCGTPRPDRQGNGRSVIVLLLESVSGAHVEMRVKDEWLMPNLRTIIDAPTARYFANHYAVGTKSNQALSAIFSGLPPQVDTHLLWQEPLPHTESLVRTLVEENYRTVYLHGSDLSFEQQRVYLRHSGFEEIYEPGPDKGHEEIGWGYADDVMFEELRGWIKSHRAQHPRQPFFSVLATLTTHDPYILPESWEPRWTTDLTGMAYRADWWAGVGDEKLAEREREAFHFLDHQLGRFYAWYDEFERARGTVLVLMGDHVAPSIVADRKRPTSERYRVPLVILGEDLPDIGPGLVGRTASQFDLHRTLGELLGKRQGRCDQGLDLLAPDEDWPGGRLVYAVEGDFNEMVVFSQDWWATFERGASRLVVGLAGRTGEDAIEPGVREGLGQRATKFVNGLFPVSRYLTSQRAYAPSGERERQTRDPYDRGREPPIVIAHRGNSRGLVAHRPPENSAAAIRQAIRDGFGWVEVDVQVTRDGIPVLFHDPVIELHGEQVPVTSLTLDELRSMPCCDHLLTLEEALEMFMVEVGFLVEAKPQTHVMHSIAMESEVGRLLFSRRHEQRLIVDSFSPKTAAAIRRICNCAGGLDLPQDVQVDDGWLQHVVNLELDWVYLEKRMVNADVVRLAHAHGLKVMVYTVNEFDDLARWGDAWPDGIITDDRRIREAVNEHFKSLGPMGFRPS